MMGAALVGAGFGAGFIVGVGIMLADSRQLSASYSRAVEAARLALALVMDEWPREHGSPRVGNVWAALDGVIRDAERISGERES